TIVILGTGVIASYYYQKIQDEKRLSAQPITNQEWKTYKNEVFGFSITYPNIFKPDDGLEDFINEGRGHKYQNNESYSYYSRLIEHNFNIQVTNAAFAESISDEVSISQREPAQEIMINGIQGTSAAYCNNSDSVCFKIFSFKKKDKFIELTFYSNYPDGGGKPEGDMYEPSKKTISPLAQQILNTLRITP
ncbi:hypothetical protein KW797_01485, partial [Candidatus Parcubacteria bacterium]|nr:hypothetical protein [Candidatus Parcubacteria bacterium]